MLGLYQGRYNVYWVENDVHSECRSSAEGLCAKLKGILVVTTWV